MTKKDDKDIPSIGASTRKILFNFLDEIKDAPSTGDEKVITKSKKNIELFSGKLSGTSANHHENAAQGDYRKKTSNRFVLSEDEANKLKSVNNDEE